MHNIINPPSSFSSDVCGPISEDNEIGNDAVGGFVLDIGSNKMTTRL